MKPWINKLIVFGVIGLILIAIGFFLSLFRAQIFNGIITTAIPLSPESRGFPIWKNSSDVPITIDFYFFNWTNPNELLIPGKKPDFVQVGPYSFIEKREKINITFHPENDTVTYLQRKFWYFNPKKSNGKLQDKIVQLNAVTISAAHAVRHYSMYLHQMVEQILSKFKLHIVRTVDELLFTGYMDELITLGRDFPLGDKPTPPFDRFGWFYMRNGTTMFDGFTNMATGQKNLDNLGMVKQWNFSDTTSFYKSPCNIVEGTTGEFFNVRNNAQEIHVWTADLCRPITYEFTENVIHKGIRGRKYEVGAKTLGNSTERRYPHEQAKYFEKTPAPPKDFFSEEFSTVSSTEVDEDPDIINIGKCFCNGDCTPMGLINVTACRYDAPAFVSLPHFYKADPVIREKVSGMDPQPEKHSFYFTIEPNTGIPIDVSARFQINFLLQPSPTLNGFKTLPHLFFPIFWFDLKSGVTEELAAGMRLLNSIPSIILYISIVLGASGAILLLVVAIISYFHFSRRKNKASNIVIGMSNSSNGKSSEMVYMDTATSNDDHERTDRQLYPKM